MNRRNFFARLTGGLAALGGLGAARAIPPLPLRRPLEAVTLTPPLLHGGFEVPQEFTAAIMSMMDRGVMTVNDVRALALRETRP